MFQFLASTTCGGTLVSKIKNESQVPPPHWHDEGKVSIAAWNSCPPRRAEMSKSHQSYANHLVQMHKNGLQGVEALAENSYMRWASIQGVSLQHIKKLFASCDPFDSMFILLLPWMLVAPKSLLTFKYKWGSLSSSRVFPGCAFLHLFRCKQCTVYRGGVLGELV